MASAADTRRPSPDVTGPRRAVLTAYRWLLLGFLLVGAVQIFLAGLGAFRIDSLNVSGETAFAPHRAVGYAMGGVALVIFILALIARAGTRTAVLAGVLFVLAFLAQSVLASLADHAALVGGLHALDGLAILGIAAFLYVSVRRRQP
jgi:Family of unknown function (DUF6220)